MSTRSRSFRLGRATAPAVALALLLGACGSNDQAGTPTPGSVASPMAPTGSADESSTESDTGQSSTDESTADESSTDASSTDESSTGESSTGESSTGESSTGESSTDESSTGESSTDESSTDESKSAESSTEKSTAAAPVKAGTPTKPGTKLKIGESAIVEYQVGKKGEKYYQHGTMTTAVTKIIKGDPKVFDKLDNKAEFKDLIPYYVITQAKILSYEGAKDGNPPTPIVIYGLLPDGSEAGKGISFSTSLAGCADTYFEAPKVGATSTKCTITLAKKGGDPVVGAEYQGDTDLYANSEDNPYTKNPVTWGP